MFHSRAIVSVFLSAGFALAAFARRATAQGVDLLQRHQFGTMDRQARSKDRKKIDDRGGTVRGYVLPHRPCKFYCICR